MKSILKRFSPEARADAMGRVYDQPGRYYRKPGETSGNPTEDGRTCADGMCILAVMLRHDFPEEYNALTDGQQKARPDTDCVYEILNSPARHEPDEYVKVINEINEIIDANDKGRLDTPEKVAALFAEESDE